MYMAVATTHPDEHRHWTAADLRDIPDDRNRYEIIDGELFVTPSPSWRHQDLAGLLFSLLGPYLEAHQLGKVLLAPADVELSDDTVIEPDLFVVPLVEGKPPARWKDVGRLLVAIEILSPSTSRVDRTVKRRRYQREGVPEYLIVDGDAHVVERWRPADERPEIISERLEWQPDPSLLPLVIDLPLLFARALGASG
ncbi:MAG TPA: Uma2 family endonuclease [Gemmatimonadaceae bacterium]|nr:Uma2 family endonuclease [Gemmatimonadaceae bacterium]